MTTRAAVVLVLAANVAAAQPVYRHADGGVAILDVERAAIMLPGDGPELARIVHVDGGAWVAPAQRLFEGQEHRDLVARNAYLENHAADVPTAIVVGVAAGGAVVGALLTVAGLVAAGRLK